MPPVSFQRQLHRELQEPADQAAEEGGEEPALDGGQAGLRRRRGRPRRRHHRGDDGEVPDDRRHVGHQEAAMAVEHPERPRRQHQEPGHREDDPHRPHGQREAVDVHLPRRHPGRVVEEAGRQHRDDQRRQQHPEQHQDADRRHQQPEDGAGETAGVVAPSLRQQPRVDRDERRRQRLLAEQVLKHVGSPQGVAEDVGERADAEELGDRPLPHQAEDLAQQDAEGNDAGAAGPGLGLDVIHGQVLSGRTAVGPGSGRRTGARPCAAGVGERRRTLRTPPALRGTPRRSSCASDRPPGAPARGPARS